MDTPTKAKKVLSKDQVALLVDLIQNNPILTSRETNAATNRCKEDTWITLASTFNARSGSVPRTKEQLKLKWDNLKKAARKRSQQIRMNSLKTGGGKPDYIPPDDILEKVSGLLGATCTGFAVPFGGDGVDIFNTGNLPEDVNEVVVNENVPALDVEVTTSNELPTFYINEEVSGETPGEGSQPKKRKILQEMSSQPVKTKIFFGIPMSPGVTAKRGKKKNDEGRSARNTAIANYYNTKSEKLQLEIKLLKLELARKENSDC